MEEKKFSEMSIVEFVTDILKIELQDYQKQMLRMFEENKGKKVEYIYNYPGMQTGGYPKVTWDTAINNAK
jgi:hypothetical protein